MARSAATVVENNLTKGLITEATGLNFPDDACTETWDCYFEPKGVVRRRLGIDIEADYARADQTQIGAITEFLWYAVGLTGTRIFYVLQVAEIVSFYELFNEQNLSNHLKAFTVDLSDYATKTIPFVRLNPCEFASGQGRLFIAHPFCDSIVVEYDEIIDDITQERIYIKQRDFEGEEDGLEPAEEPLTLSAKHHYNLKNQGWYKDEVLVVTEIVVKTI